MTNNNQETVKPLTRYEYGFTTNECVINRGDVIFINTLEDEPLNGSDNVLAKKSRPCVVVGVDVRVNKYHVVPLTTQPPKRGDKFTRWRLLQVPSPLDPNKYSWVDVSNVHTVRLENVLNKVGYYNTQIVNDIVALLVVFSVQFDSGWSNDIIARIRHYMTLFNYEISRLKKENSFIIDDHINRQNKTLESVKDILSVPKMVIKEDNANAPVAPPKETEEKNRKKRTNVPYPNTLDEAISLYKEYMSLGNFGIRKKYNISQPSEYRLRNKVKELISVLPQYANSKL